MSLYTNIRGALQSRLETVEDIPTIAWEGIDFTPTTGSAFVVAIFAPQSVRPASMGNITYRHDGTFEISVVYPRFPIGLPGGTFPAEEMADAIKARFTPDVPLELNSVFVRISYCERRAALIEPDWIRIPVSVAWFVYDDQP